MNEDLRVVKTQAAIREAFLGLLEDRSLTEITVKEITGVARCNRNTFYLHYTDKYDLMEKLCAAQLNAMKEALYHTYQAPYPTSCEWYSDIAGRILDVIESNIRFYEIVLGKNRFPAFADMYQRLMAEFIYSGLERGANKSKYKNFEVEFSASGLVGFLKYWLANREAYSKDEIAKEMYNFVVKVGDVIFQ